MLSMGDEPIFLTEVQIRNYNFTRTVHCVARHPHRSLSTTCHYENGVKLLSRRKRLMRGLIRVTPGRHIMERHVVATLHHGQNPGVMIPDEMLKVPLTQFLFGASFARRYLVRNTHLYRRSGRRVKVPTALATNVTAYIPSNGKASVRQPLGTFLANAARRGGLAR